MPRSAILCAGNKSWPLAMREALGACRSAFISLFIFSLVINLLALPRLVRERIWQ
jgi:ABC-type protease/lipase transport system fused ATPase/permease subunit